MEITFLPTDYIINATCKDGSGVESDFLLRAVRIKNTTTYPTIIKRVLFDIRTKGKIVKQIVYTQEILGNLVQRLAKNKEKFRDEIPFQIFSGTKNLWDIDLISPTVNLEPNQETGILLEHFKILQKFRED